jgi:hypothetical protein
VDLLFFGHGHAFKDAMRDYTTIGGAVPLMPWRSYGVWWSRYHRYSAESLVAEVLDGFTEHALPLHSVVLGESQMQPDRPPWYYLDVIACAFDHPILSHTAAAAAAAVCGWVSRHRLAYGQRIRPCYELQQEDRPGVQLEPHPLP